jgi:hypothetical protein
VPDVRRVFVRQARNTERLEKRRPQLKQFVILCATVLAGLVISVSHSAVAYATCTKHSRYETAPATSSDGGRGTWYLRAMTAPDAFTPPGGYTEQAIWVGTDNHASNQDWVEVGATQGWHGQNIYTYFTVEGLFGGIDSYTETRITAITPTYGTTHRFSGFRNANGTDYWAAIDGTGYVSWTNHHAPTNSWTMGYETTCGESAQVNRTNAIENQYRIQATSTWTNASSSTVGSVAPGLGGGFAWCSYPLTFRYFLRSDLDQTICV